MCSKLKKYFIIIFIIMILITIKYLSINNLQLSATEKNKLEQIKEGLILTDLLVINTEEVDKYIEYKNIKIKDIFSDYDCLEEENKYTCIKDEKTSFTIEINIPYLEKFKNYKNEIIDTTKIIKSSKILSDLELMSKIKEAKNSPSIIQINRKNKEDYILNKFALEEFPVLYSLDLVEGDYTGYLLHASANSRKLLIYFNNKVYTFTFKNLKEFNKDLIRELMNSIIIQEV